MEYDIKKNGIILLITIFFIMILMVLISEGAQTTKKSFKLVQKSRIDTQLNLTLVNIKDLIKNQSNTIKSATDLEVLYNLPIDITSKKLDAKVSIEFYSKANTIDINRIMDKNKTISQYYLAIIHNFLESYEIEYIDFYEALLLDTIDKDKDEREVNSEIITEDNYFYNGKIVSLKQIERINKYYYEKTDDIKIFSLPWQNVFGVNKGDTDINYVAYDLLKAMLPEYGNLELKSMTVNKQSVFDTYEDVVLLEQEDKDMLQSYGFKTYIPKIGCKITLEYFGQKQVVDFIYDIEDKNVTNFRFL